MLGTSGGQAESVFLRHVRFKIRPLNAFVGQGGSVLVFAVAPFRNLTKPYLA
jgi:hypothetical protein